MDTQAHKPNRGKTQEWLTPPAILKALGPFDLDPCAPAERPWDMARHHFTKTEDGLSLPWFGFVWLNPPYSTIECGLWLQRLAEHGRGIALVFARTETEWFHRWVWQEASAVLFPRGRLYFHLPSGKRAKGNAGHGSAIVAYGMNASGRIRRSGIAGHVVSLFAEGRS